MHRNVWARKFLNFGHERRESVNRAFLHEYGHNSLLIDYLLDVFFTDTKYRPNRPVPQPPSSISINIFHIDHSTLIVAWQWLSSSVSRILIILSHFCSWYIPLCCTNSLLGTDEPYCLWLHALLASMTIEPRCLIHISLAASVNANDHDMLKSSFIVPHLPAP